MIRGLTEADGVELLREPIRGRAVLLCEPDTIYLARGEKIVRSAPRSR